jgi:hypothetical protein
MKRIAIATLLATIAGVGIAQGHGGSSDPDSFLREHIFYRCDGPDGGSCDPPQALLYPPSCTKGKVRLEHGAYNHGYIQAISYGLASAYGGGSTLNPCSAEFSRNPGHLMVKYVWLKRDGLGNYKPCKVSDWKVNEIETGRLEIHRDWPDPSQTGCKNGYYKAKGQHRVYMHGDWRSDDTGPTDRHYFD